MSEMIQSDFPLGEYVYHGDRQSSDSLRGELCSAVRRPDGKCIRGKNGSMLVAFRDKKAVVIGRLLRKNKLQHPDNNAGNDRDKE
jgi:hypothetical protein